MDTFSHNNITQNGEYEYYDTCEEDDANSFNDFKA